jgi:hypothetical protein
MFRLFQNETAAGNAARNAAPATQRIEDCQRNPIHGFPAIKTTGLPVHCVVIESFEPL